MHTQIETKEFSTADLHLAAFLQAQGKIIVRTKRSGKRVHFIFEDTSCKCEELSREFWNGKGQVSAFDYSNSLKNLKNWIFSESRRD